MPLSGIEYDLIAFALVDLMARLFHHPAFVAQVVTWAAGRDAFAVRVASARRTLSSRRRILYARRLQAWRALRHAEGLHEGHRFGAHLLPNVVES